MKLNVMFIDDEELLCEVFKEYFNSAKFNISTFSDSKKALEEALKNQPDLVFIDLNIKGESGVEIAKLLPEGVAKFLVTGEMAVTPPPIFLGMISKPFEMKEIQKILESEWSKRFLK